MTRSIGLHPRAAIRGAKPPKPAPAQATTVDPNLAAAQSALSIASMPPGTGGPGMKRGGVVKGYKSAAMTKPVNMHGR